MFLKITLGGIFTLWDFLLESSQLPSWKGSEIHPKAQKKKQNHQRNYPSVELVSLRHPNGTIPPSCSQSLFFLFCTSADALPPAWCLATCNLHPCFLVSLHHTPTPSLHRIPAPLHPRIPASTHSAAATECLLCQDLGCIDIPLTSVKVQLECPIFQAANAFLILYPTPHKVRTALPPSLSAQSTSRLLF